MMQWEKEAAGVWKASTGVLKALNPVSVVGAMARTDSLEELREIDFPDCLSDMRF
jgi:hypothetical protein